MKGRQKRPREAPPANPAITLPPDTSSLEIPCSSMTYSIVAKDVTVDLTCRFLYVTGHRHQQRITYRHPSPPFTRLFVFRTGGATLNADGKEYVLEPGRIYLIPDRQDFTVTYEPSEFYYAHIHVTDHSGLSIFSDMRGIGTLRNRALCEQWVDAILHHAWHTAHLGIMQVVMHFCEPLVANLEERVRRGDRYSALLTHIQESPIPKLNVSLLAQTMHMSRSVLSRDFKRRMGTSLKAYLQEIEHKKATDLLLHTEKSVSEIAYALGFDEPTYFHRVFKKRTGMSPRKYRLSMRGRYDAE